MTAILNFLQQRVDNHCASLNTIRGYVTAISNRHDKVKVGKKRFSVSSLSSVKTWLRGLANLSGLRKVRAPQWDLAIVAEALQHPPFEPIQSIELKFLSFKTAFLIAISSGKRAVEIHALDERSIMVTPHDVSIGFVPSFRSKVLTSFHENQRVILPVRDSSLSTLPKSLCVARALKYYRARTAEFRGDDTSSRLFRCFAKKVRGQAASKITVARWIKDTILLCYKLRKVPQDKTPKRVTAHSTRKMSTSVAFQTGVDIGSICEAATWSTPSTFFQHYQLDVQRREGAKFGRGVLSAAAVAASTSRPKPSSAAGSAQPTPSTSGLASFKIPKVPGKKTHPTSSTPRKLVQTCLRPDYHPKYCMCSIHRGSKK